MMLLLSYEDAAVDIHTGVQDSVSLSLWVN